MVTSLPQQGKPVPRRVCAVWLTFSNNESKPTSFSIDTQLVDVTTWTTIYVNATTITDNSMGILLPTPVTGTRYRIRFPVGRTCIHRIDWYSSVPLTKSLRTNEPSIGTRLLHGDDLFLAKLTTSTELTLTNPTKGVVYRVYGFDASYDKEQNTIHPRGTPKITLTFNTGYYAQLTALVQQDLVSDDIGLIGTNTAIDDVNETNQSHRHALDYNVQLVTDTGAIINTTASKYQGNPDTHIIQLVITPLSEYPGPTEESLKTYWTADITDKKFYLKIRM